MTTAWGSVYEMAEDKPPNGNQQKFAWIYDLGANTSLSAPAKTVATLTALKLAGHKGYFKATHKAIANLCGMTHRTVRRAIDELADQNYWDIGSTDRGGGANFYRIIPPEDRLELWLDVEKEFVEDWLDAQREYKRLCERWLNAEYAEYRKWLDAEKRFVTEWLNAEKRFIQEWLDAEKYARREYRGRVFDAVYDRCANLNHADAVAEAAWLTHQAGDLPLADALAAIAARPQEKFPAPDESPEMDNPLSTGGQPPVQLRCAYQRKRAFP
jgi:DNA-binding transcriptional ArsR family regulator